MVLPGSRLVESGGLTLSEGSVSPLDSESSSGIGPVDAVSL